MSKMTVTTEGLRIELMESVSGTFFDSGRPQLNADGRELLVSLAQELAKLPNKISIEGHTDSKPYAASGNYSNWELSSDRAQRRPPPDAGQRRWTNPGHPGSRLRRSALAQSPRLARPFQPPRISHRALPREQQTTTKMPSRPPEAKRKNRKTPLPRNPLPEARRKNQK